MLDESLFTLVLFGIGVVFIWGPWLLAQKIRPFFGKKQLNHWLAQRNQSKKMVQAVKTLTALYANTNPARVSKYTRLKHNLKQDHFLYGEIDLITLVKLLDFIQPKPQTIFYDLGSGAGKAVLMASLTYPFAKCIGIELLAPLHQLAQKKCTLLERLAREKDKNFCSNLHFIQGNFLAIDFSDADIIFANATAYKGETWDNLVNKLKTVKRGCRIIVTTFKLNSLDFKILYEGAELMSWGFCSVRIYEKL
ncbi:MAG TPA: methyltransferase domain-containing protein [Gammaproteobacteria bacterium]|nr:methyltransferase domain-containing protein [Gammaproteobacteria bacterium]